MVCVGRIIRVRIAMLVCSYIGYRCLLTVYLDAIRADFIPGFYVRSRAVHSNVRTIVSGEFALYVT